VVLLGVVKYLARDDIGKLKLKQKTTLVGRLHSLNTLSMNIDSLKPDYLVKHIKSLVGRHFKIILQAAPFVLLEFLTPERKVIWLSLCKLCAFIFQTRISDMDVYLEQLETHIHHFIQHLIKSNAQWVNKPKVHMLLHLVECIRRFGPSSLFSTEKFESYNGVLRQASIHSNRQSPGKDLAVTFDNYSSLKFLLSGRVIFDEQTGSATSSSSEVHQAFVDNPILQRAMGYNSTAADHLVCYPLDMNIKLAKEEVVPVPNRLTFQGQNANVAQVAQIKLSKHDLLQKGVFLAVSIH
jgi:hypothetical protein